MSLLSLLLLSINSLGLAFLDLFQKIDRCVDEAFCYCEIAKSIRNLNIYIYIYIYKFKKNSLEAELTIFEPNCALKRKFYY